MEQPESGIEKFEKFTWKVENFSRLNKKVYYEHFTLEGYPWRISLFPKGNDNAKYLSIFLEAVQTANMSKGWTRDVKFKLLVFNQLNTDKTITKELRHVFNAYEDDWGQRSFMKLTKLHNTKRGFLVKDACIFGVEICVCESTNEKQVYQAVSLTSSHTVGSHVKMEVPCQDQTPLVSIKPTKDPDAESMFAAIGRIFYFLNTRKVKDMNEEACKELQILWDELEKYKFDLTWLEPHVQSVLGMKRFVEKAMEVEKLKENVVVLELEADRLKAKLVAAKVNLEVERDLLKAKGLKEIGLNSDLGLGSLRA
ncbi:protein RESTRICTED TEV MOVEMENT 3-like [Vicia villosa]|uniref:protein RESTRICTED TEV MOVEMENT 3-like n=1 Tax=Vicia villosa TaxID=3911 RepID=UPI00273BC096|nr:protein RESTRICTED TEV MOVEMENT 3-like [Vicia villosa]